MQFLLDENVSPVVAEIARSLDGSVVMESIRDWQSGRFTNQSDESILRAAAGADLVLVTFDVNTIPTILGDFAIAGETHAGVAFISSKTFPQNDAAGLAKGLLALRALHGDDDWENRIDFLTKA